MTSFMYFLLLDIFRFSVTELFLILVRIFYLSDTSSEARQMNWRRILLINLLNRHQRFNSDACHLTLKDTDQYQMCFFYLNQPTNQQCHFFLYLFQLASLQDFVRPNNLQKYMTKIISLGKYYQAVCITLKHSCGPKL